MLLTPKRFFCTFLALRFLVIWFGVLGVMGFLKPRGSPNHALIGRSQYMYALRTRKSCSMKQQLAYFRCLNDIPYYTSRRVTVWFTPTKKKLLSLPIEKTPLYVQLYCSRNKFFSIFNITVVYT